MEKVEACAKSSIEAEQVAIFLASNFRRRAVPRRVASRPSEESPYLNGAIFGITISVAESLKFMWRGTRNRSFCVQDIEGSRNRRVISFAQLSESAGIFVQWKLRKLLGYSRVKIHEHEQPWTSISFYLRTVSIFSLGRCHRSLHKRNKEGFKKSEGIWSGTKRVEGTWNHISGRYLYLACAEKKTQDWVASKIEKDCVSCRWNHTTSVSRLLNEKRETAKRYRRVVETSLTKLSNSVKETSFHGQLPHFTRVTGFLNFCSLHEFL